MTSPTPLHTLTDWVDALPSSECDLPSKRAIRDALQVFIASLGAMDPSARVLPRAQFLKLAGLRLEEDYEQLGPLVIAAKQLEAHSAAIAAYVLAFNE